MREGERDETEGRRDKDAGSWRQMEKSIEVCFVGTLDGLVWISQNSLYFRANSCLVLQLDLLGFLLMAPSIQHLSPPIGENLNSFRPI